MNSSELGSLAGVTVRTLRHYHQVGILAEPPRGSNGYRRYGVQDLIRVLRIRRLAALGVPLDQMPALLDEQSDEPAAVLDRLDAELAAQMDRIAAQRALIAQLRVLPTTPDIPPELARSAAALAAVSTPGLAAFDRDQTVLLAHMVGPEGMPDLVAFYERLSDPTLLPLIADTTARFEALGPETTDEELERFVADFAEVYRPIIGTFGESGPDLTDVSGLLAEHTASMLNPTQLHALALIGGRFDENP